MSIPKSIKAARRKRAQIRFEDQERTGQFLVIQYTAVSEAREDLQAAIEDRDTAVARRANVAVIAAAEDLINTKQRALDQSEEVLRIRERLARRLYPEDFRWLG